MNTKSMLNTITVIVITSSISTFAIANEGGPRGEQMLKHLDTDGDGQISLEEFRTPKRSPFGEADINEDGLVTMAEIEEQMTNRWEERKSASEERMSRRKAMLTEHFAAMDSDGDGGLSTTEIKQSIFNKMDQNEDGYITTDEIRRPRGMGPREGRRDGARKGRGHSRGHE